MTSIDRAGSRTAPKKLLWWSPMAAQTGTPRNVPTTAPPAAQTCGRNDAGTPMRAAASARNAFRTGSNSPSDAAFDGCITGAAAPVRRIAR